MAIRCSTPSAFTPRKDSKTMIKAFKLHSVHTQRNKANDSIKHFAVTNKVFENQQMGIVCYRDKHGEVICEGFDEGPRLSRENSGGDNHQSCNEMRRRRDRTVKIERLRTKPKPLKKGKGYSI
ncbi:uncharacterized protein LOC109718693 isoform X2 [Ananas comosus]|uniref:Uncharacterized protein LOC109718693 isoform X2 n=1 Tax=Ananas comosus TaxID=4615 RepID=A0A6P5FXB4_ANACO|nr:uncharacterized protein LOC109718693 isoform X2 [Ananas comosus]